MNGLNLFAVMVRSTVSLKLTPTTIIALYMWWRELGATTCSSKLKPNVFSFSDLDPLKNFSKKLVYNSGYGILSLSSG